ncbi:hypothetical protein F5Y05DRAFT_423214 [Hypoxylon sp. FL0543]|nr:hypothetical protein F5Y05DRAFT_423214 [Hypoxylon sp. FL0543]
MAPKPNQTPDTPTPSPRGPAQLRAAGRRLAPSPLRLRGSGSASQISAGIVPVPGAGPLSSHPASKRSGMVISGSQFNFDTMTTSPPATAPQATSTPPPIPPRSERRKRRSLVPVPSTPTTKPGGAMTDASVLAKFKAENIPPTGSLAGLAENHRDSLLLPSTRSVPRRVSPVSTEPGSEPDELMLPLRRVQRVPSPPPFELLQNTSTHTARPIPRSSIPKSRTFNAFNTITSSFSRANLSNFGRSRGLLGEPSSEDKKKEISAPLASTFRAMPEQLASPTPAPRGPPVSDANDPRVIRKAQPTSFWSGRYVVLRDQLMNENLQEENMNTILAADAERHKTASSLAAAKPSTGAGLPASSTMAYLPQRPSGADKTAAAKAADDLVDEDKRDRRVFALLEGLCATEEARNSLYDFQELYARVYEKEWLLPRGGTLAQDPKDKGKGKGLWVGRMFSGGKDKKSGAGSSVSGQ